MSEPSFRRDWITKPIFGLGAACAAARSRTPSARRSRPATSGGTPTCSPAIRTGTSSWPSRRPSCRTRSRRSWPARSKSSAHMLDDWQINWELHDLPPEVWDFLKAHKFFAMIIPKEYGGLGFSAYAHSEVIRKLSSRSLSARRDRDGAEFARARRAAAAVRHQGAAGLLAAAARARRGDSLLRADQPGGGLGRGLDDRLRRGLPRHLGGPRGRSASGSTGTSATSRSGRSRPCSASRSSCTIPIT